MGARVFGAGYKPSVLVIEDEPIIAMFLEKYLLDADCDLVATAPTLERTLCLSTTEDADLTTRRQPLHRLLLPCLSRKFFRSATFPFFSLRAPAARPCLHSIAATGCSPSR